MDDSTLVAEIRDKNPDAIGELMNIYGDRLLKAAFLIIKDEGLAQDAVQETFISAYYKIALYRNDSSLYTWLYSIMLNNCRKRLRSSWLKRVILREKHEPICDNTFESKKEDEIDIRDAVNRLPEKYRELALMFYFEDFSIKQICEATGQREGTVKSSLNRLRKILKNNLEGGYEYAEQSRNGSKIEGAD